MYACRFDTIPAERYTWMEPLGKGCESQMKDPTAQDQFDGLLAKYTELLLGEATPERIEQVKLWALYSHMHKTMPALTQHWTQSHPEGKAAVRQLFEDIKRMNEAAKSAPAGSSQPPSTSDS